MIQKLLALVAGDCVPDNPDSPMNHEILLPGHLIQMFLKVCLFLPHLSEETRKLK